jgi:hypothetical protein
MRLNPSRPRLAHGLRPGVDCQGAGADPWWLQPGPGSVITPNPVGILGALGRDAGGTSTLARVFSSTAAVEATRGKLAVVVDVDRGVRAGVVLVDGPGLEAENSVAGDGSTLALVSADCS